MKKRKTLVYIISFFTISTFPFPISGNEKKVIPPCFGENWRSCYKRLSEEELLADLKKDSGRDLGSKLDVIAIITDQYSPNNFARLFLTNDRKGQVKFLGIANEYNELSFDRATEEEHLWPIERLKEGIVIQSEHVPLLGYRDLIRLKAIALNPMEFARLRLSFSPNVAVSSEKDFINVELKACKLSVDNRERWVLWGVKEARGQDESKWPWVPIDIIDFKINRLFSATAIGLKDVVLTCLAEIPNSHCKSRKKN